MLPSVQERSAQQARDMHASAFIIVLIFSFGKDNYVTLVMFANVAFGFFAKGQSITEAHIYIYCLLGCGHLGIEILCLFIV